MSAFGKDGVRCDKCGKFSKGKPTGEYTRKDGTCGYIWPDDDNPDKDICEECLEKIGTQDQFKSLGTNRPSGTWKPEKE